MKPIEGFPNLAWLFGLENAPELSVPEYLVGVFVSGGKKEI